MYGRPAATTSRHSRAALRLSLALILTVSALPAFAQQALTGDAAREAMASAGESPIGAPALASAFPSREAVELPDGAAALVADLNQLLVPPEGLGATIATPEPAEGGSRISTLLQKALALLGTPYRWGGTDPDKGFDCSGLVGYVFRNALGIELPRVSRDMARNGELITDRAKLAAGDLVFFGRKGRVNHVGIYVGEGRFVHAPRRGRDVTVSNMATGYWSGKFMQARRVGDIGI
jgi:cell wall-associated NlpC family hydrolase